MMPRHLVFAFLAFLLILPVGLTLTSIFFGVEGIETLLKSVFTEGESLNAFGRIFFQGGVLALPVALGIALWPVLRQRRPYIANLIVALLALALIIPIGWNLGEEIYRCDILHIPNCD